MKILFIIFGILLVAMYDTCTPTPQPAPRQAFNSVLRLDSLVANFNNEQGNIVLGFVVTNTSTVHNLDSANIVIQLNDNGVFYYEYSNSFVTDLDTLQSDTFFVYFTTEHAGVMIPTFQNEIYK